MYISYKLVCYREAARINLQGKTCHFCTLLLTVEKEQVFDVAQFMAIVEFYCVPACSPVISLDVAHRVLLLQVAGRIRFVFFIKKIDRWL